MFGRKLRRILTILLLCSSYWPSKATAAAKDDVQQVPVTANTSLRMLSEEYLGNQNEWGLILAFNGLKHSDQVQAGMSLRVPAGLYKKLSHHLAQSASLISEANREGAALLSEQDLAEAVRLRDQALQLKKTAKLREAIQQASLAEAKAHTALEKAKGAQNHSVKAWLATKIGTVQNRPSDTSYWQNTKLNQELSERERVRTLANSHCTIKFSDQSQIVLDEHALVAIGSMEKNVIHPTYDNNISIISGKDIDFHLSSLNQGKQFKVNLGADITANIRSRNFETSRDEDNVTRVANYDGEIDIKAGGRQVTVKKNQGTKIEPGQPPSTPKELLPAPPVLIPKPAQEFYNSPLIFTWQAIPGAKHYRVEISRQATFKDLFATNKVNDQSFYWQVPESGSYFFRIQTINQDGCSGIYSKAINFVVNLNNQPPFLVLHYPEKNIVIADKEIEVRGEVDKAATLRINGHEIQADATGHFRHKLAFAGRKLIVKAEAVDKSSNISTVKRTVTFRPEDEQLIQLTSPKRIISKTKEITISGRLREGTQLQVNKKPLQADGIFTLLLNLDGGEHVVDLDALAPDGQKETVQVQVLVDLQQPKIAVDDIEPTTSAKQIVLTGSLSEEATVSLNGKQISLSKNRFRQTVPLVEGKNELLLVAEDPAGNKATWSKNILRDSQPPKVLGAKLSPDTTKGGEVVQVIAQIQDTGIGIAKTGSFVLEVNGQLFKGVLRSSGDNFVGSVFILPGLRGPVKVREIQIQDMLGNTTTSLASSKNMKSSSGLYYATTSRF